MNYFGLQQRVPVYAKPSFSITNILCQYTTCITTNEPFMFSPKTYLRYQKHLLCLLKTLLVVTVAQTFLVFNDKTFLFFNGHFNFEQQNVLQLGFVGLFVCLFEVRPRYGVLFGEAEQLQN